MNNNEFYDNISSDYDGMINFRNLVEVRKNILCNYILRDYKTAIDIGCGTGVDSIALATNGLKVTGYDPSKLMIYKARENAKKKGLSVKFRNSSFNTSKQKPYIKADLIISLGNAIANIQAKELSRLLKIVYKSLNTGGRFLIQVLNYESIRKKNNRIINITESNKKIFVRFYDFEKNIIRFNILIINKDNLKKNSLFTTRLYDHNKKYLLKQLSSLGFINLICTGDFKGTPYNKQNSKDLIILAQK